MSLFNNKEAENILGLDTVVWRLAASRARPRLAEGETYCLLDHNSNLANKSSFYSRQLSQALHLADKQQHGPHLAESQLASDPVG